MIQSNLSDQSIQRLKAEILAADWKLSPRRIEQIEAALTCLNNYFHGNESAQGLITIAHNVINFIKKNDNQPIKAIDFLKEALAHIVSVYEEDLDQTTQANILFKRAYHHFKLLKKHLPAISQKYRPTPSTPTFQAYDDQQLTQACSSLSSILQGNGQFSPAILEDLQKIEKELTAFISQLQAQNE